jgi:hypothetical protein
MNGNWWDAEIPFQVLHDTTETILRRQFGL